MRLSCLPLVVAICALAAPALADTALAIDENQGDQWGWAVDFPTMAHARNRALMECGEGCRIVLEFTNGCGAYVVDATPGSTIWSWGRSSTIAGARYTAMTECIKRGGTQCIGRVWGCNRQPMTEDPQAMVEGEPSADAVTEDAPQNETAAAAGRLVFLHAEAYRELPNERYSYTHYCGWTQASAEELSRYVERQHRAFFTENEHGFAPKGTPQQGLWPADNDGATHHRLDVSPIAQRFVAAIKAHPEYEPPTGSKYWPDGPYQVYKGLSTMMGWIYEINSDWSLDDLTAFHCDYSIRQSNMDSYKEVPLKAVVIGKF